MGGLKTRWEELDTLTTCATAFDLRSFFPNFFHDLVDITTYADYLSAVEDFSKGNFRQAASRFSRWLTLNSHRHGRGDTSYDSNEFHSLLCIALSEAKEGVPSEPSWAKAQELLDAPNRSIPRTSRALWEHLAVLRALAVGPRAGLADKEVSLTELLRRAQDEWFLLSPSAPLKGRDRGAGLKEQIRLPSCLDVFPLLPIVGEYWRLLLWQSTRNAVLLRADFETRLREIMPSDLAEAPPDKAPFEIEKMGDTELWSYLEASVASRASASNLRILRKTEALWRGALKAVSAEGRAEAEIQARKFFETFRSVPHVVTIDSCRATTSLRGPAAGALRRYTVSLTRRWRHSPTQLKLEVARPVAARGHAYLRPRWNRNLKPHYRANLEAQPLLPSRVPEWMETFEHWAAGRGYRKPEVFLRWCSQFPPRWRIVALRLLTRLQYFSDEDIRGIWRESYSADLPANLKGAKTLYVGLGRAGKSGPMQLYLVKQAVGDLPTSQRSFDTKTAFRSVDALSEEGLSADSIVFVDDFVGTGQQATSFLQGVLEKYPWIEERSLYLWALVGFDDAVQHVKDYTPQLESVVVGRRLAASAHAFSVENSLWDSDQDRESAAEWCRQLGRELLSGEFNDPAAHALGWNGSEALLAFSYNTPNNTLPIFWAKGMVQGEVWEPLLPRFYER